MSNNVEKTEEAGDSSFPLGSYNVLGKRRQTYGDLFSELKIKPRDVIDGIVFMRTVGSTCKMCTVLGVDRY